MKTVIEMAREAGISLCFRGHPDRPERTKNNELTYWAGVNQITLKAFAELVRADEREHIITKNTPEIERCNSHIKALEQEILAEREKYKWDIHSCGPDCKRYACVSMREAVAAEREACAKVCEQSEIPIPIDVWHGSTKKEMTEHTALALAKAIRARGNT